MGAERPRYIDKGSSTAHAEEIANRFDFENQSKDKYSKLRTELKDIVNSKLPDRSKLNWGKAGDTYTVQEKIDARGLLDVIKRNLPAANLRDAKYAGLSYSTLFKTVNKAASADASKKADVNWLEAGDTVYIENGTVHVTRKTDSAYSDFTADLYPWGTTPTTVGASAAAAPSAAPTAAEVPARAKAPGKKAESTRKDKKAEKSAPPVGTAPEKPSIPDAKREELAKEIDALLTDHPEFGIDAYMTEDTILTLHKADKPAIKVQIISSGSAFVARSSEIGAYFSSDKIRPVVEYAMKVLNLLPVPAPVAPQSEPPSAPVAAEAPKPAEAPSILSEGQKQELSEAGISVSLGAGGDVIYVALVNRPNSSVPLRYSSDKKKYITNAGLGLVERANLLDCAKRALTDKYVNAYVEKVVEVFGPKNYTPETGAKEAPFYLDWWGNLAFKDKNGWNNKVGGVSNGPEWDPPFEGIWEMNQALVDLVNDRYRKKYPQNSADVNSAPVPSAEPGAPAPTPAPEAPAQKPRPSIPAGGQGTPF